MIAKARNNFGKRFFFEAFATAAWNIWKQMNAHIFDNVTPSVRSWSFSFKRDIFLLSYRMKDDLNILARLTPCSFLLWAAPWATPF
jgi:hypothetical protein